MTSDTPRGDATTPDLDAIRARATEATPPPWRWFNAHANGGLVADEETLYGGANTPILSSDGGYWPDEGSPDHAFMANARADIDTLLDALAAARSEKEALQQTVESLRAVAKAAREWHAAMNAQRFDGPRISAANDVLHAAVAALAGHETVSEPPGRYDRLIEAGERFGREAAAFFGRAIPERASLDRVPLNRAEVDLKDAAWALGGVPASDPVEG